MVMKAHTKTIFRLFQRHIARFITVLAIVIVSIGFSAGIGELENKIENAMDGVYREQNLADLYIKSKHDYGFTPAELESISKYFENEDIEKNFTFEIEEEETALRVHALDIRDKKVNQFELLEGKYPEKPNEILAERKTSVFQNIEVGDKMQVNGMEYTVSGIVYNAWYIFDEEEQSFQWEDKTLSGVLYIPTENLPITNDIFISLSDREERVFSDKYEDTMYALKSEITSLLGEEAVSVLSLYENIGAYTLVSYAEKVGMISIIFVAFFILVTLLVVYSTMSRLLEEERGQIACQKTLGYSDGRIIGKYVWFIGIATLIGGGISYAVSLILTSLLYNGFNLQYRMPPLPKFGGVSYYPIFFLCLLVASISLTYFSGKSLIAQKPATLLTPKAPKSGKKVILERIPWLWNRLSFKYKSTLRNVLLFKSRFFMTVISVIGSTVLVFAGIGLLDCILKETGRESLASISAAIIVFSAVLCALVVYNLTNINVSERKREIATLMVLGYQDREVTGYIFREIYIMSAIGAILGLPFGVLFIDFAFALIDFGSLADITFKTYILTPCLTMFFSFIATLLLRKKIIRTDMNASLKTVE